MDSTNKLELEGVLLSRLDSNLHEDDYNAQEKYFSILNKLIDAVSHLRYDRYSKYFGFYSLDTINDFVLGNCKLIDLSKDNKESMIKKSATKLWHYINIKMDMEYFENTFSYLYKIYKENGNTLPKDLTTSIYNKLLNLKENHYISSKKKLIIRDEIKPFLALTDKKRESLKTNLSLKRAKDLIKNNDYITLGISKEELYEKMKQLHSYLNTMKQFKKEKITIEQFQIFDNLFLNGNLNIETILTIYPDINKDNAKKILAKYDKILLPYLDNIDIELTIDNIDYSQVEFNYNHLKILDKYVYSNNVSLFCNKCSSKELVYILKYFDTYKYNEIFELLQFINLFPEEFNVNIFKSIILNYDTIIETMHKRGKYVNKNDFNTLLVNLKDVIAIAQAFSNADIYALAVFGEKFLELIFNNPYSSSDSNDYTDVYQKMLSLSKSYIPPLSLKFNNFIMESGNNYDTERLLIGKRVIPSCIAPNGSGSEAYYEVLTKKSADVLIITDKSDNDFYARSLMFRRGNFVVLAPFYGEYQGINNILYRKDILEFIGNKIIETAKYYGDNLDYVFISENPMISLPFILYKNGHLINHIPHSDVSDSCYLIGSKEKVRDISDIKIKEREEVKVSYDKKRKKPIIKSSNYIDDVKRIKALQIYFSNSTEEIEKLKKEFTKIADVKYSKVYIGGDWYIGQKEDNSIDKCILPTNDYRQQKEIDSALNMIVDELSNNSSIELLSFNKVL